MGQHIPASMSELTSIDNLPTGSVYLRMSRYEMPDKICVERYHRGIGLAWPEQAVYVPERTCRNVAEQPSDGTFWPAPHFECSECGHKHVSMSYVYHCPNCGAKVIEEDE